MKVGVVFDFVGMFCLGLRKIFRRLWEIFSRYDDDIEVR